MICQFSVKNYKSFQNKMTLDLRATNISEQEGIFVDLNDGQKFLPLAGIYGPNGGGKTNVIDSILCLVSKVMKPICAVCDQKDCSEVLSKPKKIIPYKFNEKTVTEPTEFEIYFRTKKAEYKYNLSVKKENIIFESLFMLKFNSTKPTQIFIRNSDSKKQIVLNKLIFKNINVSGVTDTLPLLSYLGITNKKIEVIEDVFDWFENGIEIINYGSAKVESQIAIPKSDKTKEIMLNMMKEMDIDIEDYRVDDEDNDHIMVYTKHVVNNAEFELNLSEESRGTFKILGLLPHICESIQRGTILIIDELDAKIHPKLLEYIIGLYKDVDDVNKKGAQLIFTSHDLMTMTSEFFRRDEIWFVAKNSEQSSKLYSLVEFKKENGKSARKDEKYGKQYLEGRYGADPYLRRMIDWSKQLE